MVRSVRRWMERQETTNTVGLIAKKMGNILIGSRVSEVVAHCIADSGTYMTWLTLYAAYDTFPNDEAFDARLTDRIRPSSLKPALDQPLLSDEVCSQA